MSESNKNKLTISIGNLSLSTVLFIVFLVLKLTGYITWSWWWVTAPLWASPVLFFGIIAIALCLGLVGLILYALYELINYIFNKY